MKCLDDILSREMVLALALTPMAGQPLHLKRQAGPPVVNPVKDRFTPHEPPLNWIALGDSYTASPGTGDDYDRDKACRRNVGSYAIQLKNDFPFTEANDMDFIACSGYTAPETLTKTIPVIEQDEADLMIMTLGGNDIGFSSIAIDCLVRPGLIFGPLTCEQILSKAEREIADVKLENNIHAVYDAIFEKMKDDYHYQLYHIFYSRFFNDQTDWCDFQTFSTPITGPKLFKRRRQRINQLSDLLNSRLEEIANNYIQKKKGRPSWNKGSRLITINPEKLPVANGTGTYALYEGHRFCEPGTRTLEDPNVWFFGTIDRDNTLDSEDIELIPTAVQRREISEMLEVSQHNNTSQDPNQLPEFVVRCFHPKTSGMKAVKRALQESLQRSRPAER